MNQPLEIFIPGTIRAKQRPRFNSKLKIAITHPQTVAYENLIKHIFTQKYPQHTPIVEEPIKLTMIINYAVPKSTSKKKAHLMLTGHIRPTKKPDCDNVLKQIDALNKIAFHDDSQIVDVVLSKKYSQIEGVFIKLEVIKLNQIDIQL